MSDFDLKDMLATVHNIALQGMKSGQEIGRREGLEMAAAMCEAKAKLHAEYLPTPTFQFNQPHPTTGKIFPGFSATCGRRDECSNLAYEIRLEITAPVNEE